MLYIWIRLNATLTTITNSPCRVFLRHHHNAKAPYFLNVAGGGKAELNTTHRHWIESPHACPRILPSLLVLNHRVTVRDKKAFSRSTVSLLRRQPNLNLWFPGPISTFPWLCSTENKVDEKNRCGILMSRYGARELAVLHTLIHRCRFAICTVAGDHCDSHC